MDDAIEVEALVKNFGRVEALKGASFSVKDREIFGLIGPNGAGKTTALRILSTLISPTAGYAKVFGLDVVKEPVKIREMISYLPEEAGAYQNLSGHEYLEFMAEFYDNGDRSAVDMLEEGKYISGLKERLNDRVKGYSKGMKRRLLLARALMMKPRLAILDEPTSGLDVIHAVHVRQTIRDYVDKQGVTTLISSHNMLEVEYLCHRVALIDEGVIIAVGTPPELMDKFSAENLEEAFMEATKLG
ncbi:ABC transporter ATP-binding protein [Candidatus Bathyarchaeota archaeon]|nr:ABC transporter ATP-binding protein [Candidatus Bathyarchaeota archaeon]